MMPDFRCYLLGYGHLNLGIKSSLQEHIHAILKLVAMMNQYNCWEMHVETGFQKHNQTLFPFKILPLHSYIAPPPSLSGTTTHLHPPPPRNSLSFNTHTHWEIVHKKGGGGGGQKQKNPDRFIVHFLPHFSSDLGNLSDCNTRIIPLDALSLLVEPQEVGWLWPLGCIGILATFLALRLGLAWFARSFRLDIHPCHMKHASSSSNNV